MSTPRSYEGLLPKALACVLPPTLLVLAAIAVMSISTVRHATTQETAKRLEAISDRTANELARRLYTVREFTRNLADNALVVNAIVDAEAQRQYLPLLFRSLTIPGSANARISVSDYRGRELASNGVFRFDGAVPLARKKALIKRTPTLELSGTGVIVAAPVMFGGRPEGLVLVEFGEDGLPGLLNSHVYTTYSILLSDPYGHRLFASSAMGELSDSTAASDAWVRASAPLPGFPGYTVSISEPKEIALARTQEAEKFLVFGVSLSFIAVVAGLLATALLVRSPLMAAIDAAHAANRTKSEFLASMSHEIRTPMNGVIGMSRTLLQEKLTPQQRQSIEIIESSGSTLLRLLNDILDISKIEAGKLEIERIPFDLRQIASDTAALWEPHAAAKRIGLRIHTEGIVFPLLESDPTRIKQIIFNFASNAIKFTDAGNVDITLTQTKLDNGKIHTRCSVRDSGIGIDSETLRGLFKPFTQADRSVTRKYGGTGLGLAICRNLADALDGEVGAESAPGSGSEFWLTFVSAEMNADDVENAGPKELMNAETGGKKALRILVAEDNKVNQFVIETILSRADHTLEFANDGNEAIAAFVRSPFDVVLMDIQIPYLDGITATTRIRELEAENVRTPIIALTANAMAGDRERYIAAGMSDYVSKPIDPPELFAALRRQCGEDVTVRYDLPIADPTVAGPVEISDLDEIFDGYDDLLRPSA